MIKHTLPHNNASYIHIQGATKNTPREKLQYPQTSVTILYEMFSDNEEVSLLQTEQGLCNAVKVCVNGATFGC